MSGNFYARCQVECVERVRRFLTSGRWHTLAEISQACGCSEAAASARLRDLRKEAYGAHRVQRSIANKRLSLYRLVPGSQGQGLPRTRARLLAEIDYWKKRASHYAALWRAVVGLPLFRDCSSGKQPRLH